MVDALAKIPDVEIDTEGTFKYILVRVKVKDGSLSKDIVRGTKSAQYHSKLKTYEPTTYFRSICSLQRFYPLVIEAQQCFVVFLSKPYLLSCSQISLRLNVVFNSLKKKFLLLADHIFENVGPAVEALGLDCECLGGGKMEHNSQEKTIRVFGESTVSSSD